MIELDMPPMQRPPAPAAQHGRSVFAAECETRNNGENESDDGRNATTTTLW